MVINNAGIRVDGAHNPNWKGGIIKKVCYVCSKEYEVKRANGTSKYCSLKCVGISQKGKSRKENLKITIKSCMVCEKEYSKPSSHAYRYYCCSKECSDIRRSKIMSGKSNPNWNGGLSRLPYTWNFRELSKKIINRDGNKCQNPTCNGNDARMTTHHINHDKQDCSAMNLIALCSSCNSKANFNKSYWVELYVGILKAKKDGGGWAMEVFGE